MQTTSTPPIAAAKPRRKWRWRYFLGFAVFMIAALVGFYFFIGWQADRELNDVFAELDADDPNWRWPDLIAELEPPPDEENSAVQVLKVARLLNARPFNPRGKWITGGNDKALNVRNARLSEENLKPLRTAFAALDPRTLAEARKLKNFPDGRFRIEGNLDNPLDLKLDSIQDSRTVIYMLQCDVLLRCQDRQRNLRGAAESCLAMVHVAHAINDHPTLIGQLVRNAEQAIAVGAVERLLGQGVVPEADLSRLQMALQREADANTLYYGMRGELGGSNQFYQAVRSGKTPASMILGGRMRPPSTMERVVDFFPGFMLRGQPEYLRLMHEGVKASKLPDAERDESFDKITAKAKESNALPVRLLMPALAKVSLASHRLRAGLRCAVAALAVERYRLKHNAWPKGLDDLVGAGLLKEVPTDPFDGKPLRFKRTATGVLVYSVGIDKIDDGGKIDLERPYTPGTDIGFMLWNPAQRGIPPPAEEEVP